MRFIFLTIKGIRKAGIEVRDALVLLDREQGGIENVSEFDVKIHSILKTNDILNILLKKKKINQDVFQKTIAYLNSNRNISVTFKSNKVINLIP